MKALKNKKLIITAAVAVVVLAGAVTAYLVISKRSKKGDASSAAGSGSKLIGGTVSSTSPIASSPSVATKSNEELAKEVIRGDWGNGDERRERLTAAGYDYAAIQAIVNQLM